MCDCVEAESPPCPVLSGALQRLSLSLGRRVSPQDGASSDCVSHFSPSPDAVTMLAVRFSVFTHFQELFPSDLSLYLVTESQRASQAWGLNCAF